MSKKGQPAHHIEGLEMQFPTTSIGDSKPVVEFIPAKDPPKPEVSPDQIEDFSVDGKKVYSKNTKTGEYTWFDAEGKEVSGYQLESLNKGYTPYPEIDDLGTERDGPLQKREVDENNNSPGHQNFKETIAISERQNYKSGQAITRTIPLKFAGIVKTLRGETDGKKDGDAKDKEK